MKGYFLQNKSFSHKIVIYFDKSGEGGWFFSIRLFRIIFFSVNRISLYFFHFLENITILFLLLLW